MNDDDLVQMHETESYSWPLLTFLSFHFSTFQSIFWLVLGLSFYFEVSLLRSWSWCPSRWVGLCWVCTWMRIRIVAGRLWSTLLLGSCHRGLGPTSSNHAIKLLWCHKAALVQVRQCTTHTHTPKHSYTHAHISLAVSTSHVKKLEPLRLWDNMNTEDKSTIIKMYLLLKSMKEYICVQMQTRTNILSWVSALRLHSAPCTAPLKRLMVAECQHHQVDTQSITAWEI